MAANQPAAGTADTQPTPARAAVSAPVPANDNGDGVCLVLAIVQDEDASTVVHALTGAGLRVTGMRTVGGFLRKGNATLLMGVERERVPEVLRILRQHCTKRTDQVVPTVLADFTGLIPIEPIEVTLGGATVFVMNVARYERL